MNICRRSKGFAREQTGLTLVEMLIVLSIMGVLAAVVLANVTGVTTGGREKSLAADRGVVQAAVDNYYGNTNRYPTRTGLGYATVADDAYIDFYYLIKGGQLRTAPQSAAAKNYTSATTVLTTPGSGNYNWWVNDKGEPHSQNTDGATDTYNGKYP